VPGYILSPESRDDLREIRDYLASKRRAGETRRLLRPFRRVPLSLHPPYAPALMQPVVAG
jgi:plasmid stabilization system protein ParE